MSGGCLHLWACIESKFKLTKMGTPGFVVLSKSAGGSGELRVGRLCHKDKESLAQTVGLHVGFVP